MGMFGLVFLAVVVLLLVYAIGLYNRLVRLRALVKEGFSGKSLLKPTSSSLISLSFDNSL